MHTCCRLRQTVLALSTGLMSLLRLIVSLMMSPKSLKYWRKKREEQRNRVVTISLFSQHHWFNIEQCKNNSSHPCVFQPLSLWLILSTSLVVNQILSPSSSPSHPLHYSFFCLTNCFLTRFISPKKESSSTINVIYFRNYVFNYFAHTLVTQQGSE